MNKVLQLNAPPETRKIWVLLGGQWKQVNVGPKHFIGGGREANVYHLTDLVPGGERLAVKIFKRPDDAQFQAVNEANKRFRADAETRLREGPERFKQIPANLPSGVIAPKSLVYIPNQTTNQNDFAGFLMDRVVGGHPLERYLDLKWRKHNKINNAKVMEIFLDLHRVVALLHSSSNNVAVQPSKAGVVVGDFSPFNILVSGSQTYFVDVDAMQYGQYRCLMFTEGFADPKTCEERQGSLIPVRPFSIETDWYSFAVMLFTALLGYSPYDGVYQPEDLSRMVPENLRPLKALTVFRKDVRKPSGFPPPHTLPQTLFSYFLGVFERGEREVFPVELLKGVVWSRCARCSVDYARGQCPGCAFRDLKKQMAVA